MLFKYLENLKNSINEEDFREIFRIAFDDIKFNRITLGKLTKPEKFIKIIESSRETVSRC